MNRAIALLLLIPFLASSVHAGGKGTTAAPFLKVPVNGRAVAMAGSFTAVRGDVTSLEYNPAGLAGLRRTDIALTYIDHLENTSFQSAAVGFPFFLPKKRSGPEPEEHEFDRRRVATALRYTQFRADDDARNEVGVKQGSISIQDQLFHLALAFPLGPRLGLGLGLKSIRQELDTASTSRFAADAGLLWLTTHAWSIGASVLNIGPAKAFEEEKDPSPTLLRLGVSKPVRNFLFAADAARGRDAVTRFSTGAEWNLRRQFFLRGGVFHESEVGLTGGLGFLFSGPQKAAPAASRPRLRSDRRSQELVFNEQRASELLDRLNFLAIELTERFDGSGRKPKDYSLAVLPASGAGERMGPALADLLGQQFYQQETFPMIERAKIEAALREAKIPPTKALDDAEASRIGQALGARAIAVSQLTKSPTSYGMQTRIIVVETETAAAFSTATFPADAFTIENRQPLESVPSTTEARAQLGRMDIGLDYGLSTQGDLGMTHTLSLRILY